MRFHNDYLIKIGNNSNDNGFYISSGKFQGQLLKNPKIYDFQEADELTKGENKFTELEIFEINFN